MKTSNTYGTARRQRGVVLIVALVLLIAISFVAALAVGRSISGEQVSKAFSTQAVAFQAAETALRYCEDQVLRTGKVTSGGVTHEPHPYPLDGTAPALWSSRANWEPSGGKAVEIDAGVINSLDPAARTLPKLPRCMVEQLRLNSDEGAARQTFLITAVGFSRDYRLVSGKPDTGGEVWLQSTVTP